MESTGKCQIWGEDNVESWCEASSTATVSIVETNERAVDVFRYGVLDAHWVQEWA